MNLIEYFERQKQRCERELRYAECAGFQLFAKTLEGEKDVTAEHIKQLRESRDDYQRVIDQLKSGDHNAEPIFAPAMDDL